MARIVPVGRPVVGRQLLTAGAGPVIAMPNWGAAATIAAAPQAPTPPPPANGGSFANTIAGLLASSVLNAPPSSGVSVVPVSPAQPVSAIPVAAPVPPTISLGQAQQVLASAPTSAAASAVIAGTVASAQSGHPQGIANAAVLTVAQRLQTMAAFVSKYVGPAPAAAVLSGSFLVHS